MKYTLTAVMIAAMFLAGCGGDSREAKEKELKALTKERDALTSKITKLESELGLDTIKPAGRHVTTMAVKQEHFKHFIDIQGTVTSDENVSVTTDIGGTVIQVLVKEGDRVRDVLGRAELAEWHLLEQRLARGRKVLQEQVLVFVEGALTRTTPGKVFTIGVLAALPAFVPVQARWRALLAQRPSFAA